MAGDYSRFRFDPRRDFSKVLLQQGRVLLDADFNELVAIFERRLLAETVDLTSFGPDPDHAGESWVPRETPDAFRVTASGGELTIGRGRMYVDGLLAENHGGAPAGFDALLREPTGTADTAYDHQPYWPTPDPLPGGGPHLAYLDVWEREITALEDPDLVEIAVGVDTTTRVQTAWQVRLLPNTGNATCDTDDDQVPGWVDTIAPSAGRLTTGTVDVGADDDPCELPPEGGYRGLENQTYRVEVHDGGAPGTATFKWSRDNGSVAIPVVEMVSTTVLRLTTVGKDDVLRVSSNDWVEVLDDHYELNRRPGVLRKVTVDDAERTITFSPAIPPDLRPANADDAAKRHLRVRRWDQAGVVKDGNGNQLTDLDASGSSGLITVPSSASTQVQLEHGVVASFSLAAGGSGVLNSGDYWIFAARTADASVEELDAAPPLGIHHHYARLGFVTFPGSQTDCRRLWPPLGDGGGGCECTVCVTPGEHPTLQEAVDQVKTTGGTICLTTGVHDLGMGVDVNGARSLRIRGQGPATILVSSGTALTIEQSVAVTVENLAVVSGSAAPAAIALRSVIDTTLQDLVVLSYPSAAGTAPGSGGSAVELSSIAMVVALRRNVLIGNAAVDAGGSETDNIGVFAIDLRVEDNVAAGFDRGIDLGGRSAYLLACRVEGNEVLSGSSGGIIATGLVAPGGTLDVAGNKVATGGPGITVGSDATVDSNAVNKLTSDAAGADGIVVDTGGFSAAAGHVRITGNRIHDRTGTGIALRTAVKTLMVKENVIEHAAAGIAIEGRGVAERVAVDNNEVLDVATTQDAALPIGILLLRATSAGVVGNTVRGVGQSASSASLRAGIVVAAIDDIKVRGNVVDEIGPPGGFLGLASGIVVIGPFDAADVSDNSSRFGAASLAPSEGSWNALIIQSAGAGNLVRFGAGMAVAPTGTGAFVLTNGWGFAAVGRGDHTGVAANMLSGGGALPTCFVRVVGDAVVQGNQCTHDATEQQPTGAFVQALSISAAGNRVRAGQSMLVLQVDPKRFAALGNLASGGTHLNGPGNGLPAPWAPLNPTVP
jgi:Family of unknown function (DUF6519)/Right handed beta helix region